MENIKTFDEFLKSNKANELEKIISKEIHILKYEDWLKQQSKVKYFLFLTYDLLNVKKYPNNIYNIINGFLEQKLHFSTAINGKNLTNNSFILFLNENSASKSMLQNIEVALVRFFSNHLNGDFRIYLNITDENSYILHS